jgi:hypothetical protein
MDLPSIVGSSLRDVIEASVTDRVLPYRILSLGHLSSWNTFQRDLTEIFRRYHSTFDHQVSFSSFAACPTICFLFHFKNRSALSTPRCSSDTPCDDNDKDNNNEKDHWHHLFLNHPDLSRGQSSFDRLHRSMNKPL